MNQSKVLQFKQRRVVGGTRLIRFLPFALTVLLTTITSCAASSGSSGVSSQPTVSSGAAGSTGSQGQAATSGLLARVQSRGKLVCGASGTSAGFSFVNAQGKYSGFDIDLCRAVAAAVFGDPEKIEFRKLSYQNRFTAVQTAEVDVLSQGATVTINRATELGLDFAPITFYDGQGLMVKTTSGIKELKGLAGKSICVMTGTTTEQNLADQMRKRQITYKPVVFGDKNAVFAAYQQGRCDGYTADRTSLVADRTKLPAPNSSVVLDEVLSKEPIALVVKQGDPQWSNVVRWTMYALIQADELNINSKNVEQLAQSSTDPEVKRFLGKEGDLAKGLGLPNDFILRVIKSVGNYDEIYDRNLGSNTQFKLARGVNKLWSQGGLLYSPPFR